MIGAAIRKDLALLVGDRAALISLFALPIVFMAVFGAIFRYGADRDEPRAIAIWHAPGDPRGAAITSALAATEAFAPAVQASPDAVRAQVAGQHVVAGIVVPADRTSAIELVVDHHVAAPPHHRAIADALEGAIVRALLPPDVVLPTIVVRAPPGARPAEPLSGFQFAVPGNAVLFGFFLAVTVAMSFAGERRTGTWRRLLAAPVPRWHALAAMLVPYYVIGVIQLACLFAIGIGVFGMHVAGSWVALVAISLAVVYATVALGLLFAALGGSERALGGVGSVVLLVMGMVGGCMVPRAIMPPVLQTLGLAVPHGWALDGYQDVLVRAGTTLADVMPEIAALLAFGTGFAIVGLSRFRFER
jgi:ABC-2 type transport system permease protein